MLRRVAEPNREYSLQRLEELRNRLREVDALLAGHPLCVYATGSYGRLEAWAGSDIDLFFLYDGSEEHAPFPWTTFVRLSAHLIAVTEQMGFPPFSGDGRYLEIQYVRKMEQVLGSPSDDSLNAFTARMLLLLESRPLTEEPLYLELLERIIGFYYRDFEGNEADFVPVFLQNDILRFWRTLTLNYEHHRLKLLALSGEELARKKAESALKNYKLKVSRLAICFSMVANLSSEPAPVRPETVLELCRLTPRERFARLAEKGSRAAELVDRLSALHTEFLDSVQRDEETLVAEFREPARRREALDRAAEYGDRLYELIGEVTPSDRMRHLVI